MFYSSYCLKLGVCRLALHYDNLLSSFVLLIDSASTSFSQSSQGGGHRTLLYGHAILLKHTHSNMVSTFAVKMWLLLSSHNANLLSFSLCCSTWAVWLLHAHWQTSWLLMWACRKTPQVDTHFTETSVCTHADVDLYSKSICLSQVRPAGGPSIQPPNRGLKARRSG